MFSTPDTQIKYIMLLFVCYACDCAHPVHAVHMNMYILGFSGCVYVTLSLHVVCVCLRVWIACF